MGASPPLHTLHSPGPQGRPAMAAAAATGGGGGGGGGMGGGDSASKRDRLERRSPFCPSLSEPPYPPTFIFFCMYACVCVLMRVTVHTRAHTHTHTHTLSLSYTLIHVGRKSGKHL